MLQGPCRALLADLASSNSTKIRAGNTLFAFFMAVRNVLGYSAGSYTHLYRISPFTKTDACDIFCANLKTCFLISVALLISIMLLAVWAVSEDPYVPEAAVENGATGKQHIVGALKELSKPMWILLLVTFFNWLAWFPFLLFDMDWMGKDIYGGKLGAQLYNRGVPAGALGLMLNSVVSGLASLCIERLARWVGGVKRLWGGMNFLLAVCLAMTLVVTHIARCEPEFTKATPKPGVVGLALATFAVLGAPLAMSKFSVTFSVPCALASIFYNNSRAGQVSGYRIIGLFEIFEIHIRIRIRKFGLSGFRISKFSDIQNFGYFGYVFSDISDSVSDPDFFEHPYGPWDSLMGGGNMPAFVVRAVAAAVSGIIAFTMLPSPPPDVLETVSGGGGMH
ncbi:putative MFS transporter superfamily [Helianthus annuus]|uniref:MFS transporter superfamily n=1 Tax=Helianthus annuus TaxID=4232 RepID=A0A9K3JT17_HELAN|nr:putative MFS transporter superfamily [Helianthus annuus]KAJ0625527.1 putative MFS transporter superfamily [Helianthus annuus]KAJ0781922.1 putative MFS transporter superfamily [Helianthus annuus]